MILLDTHVLIWMDIDDGSLGQASKREIQRFWARQQVAVSAVSFWESALLHCRNKITLRVEPFQWRLDLLAAGLQEVPVSGEIAILAAELESLHGDPADRIIAATAIDRHARLITADQRLLKWKHALRRDDAKR